VKEFFIIIFEAIATALFFTSVFTSDFTYAIIAFVLIMVVLILK